MITQQLINAPGADSVANITAADVVGNKTDTVAGNSIVAVSKQVKAKTDLIGTIVNTGGTAELGAALGDFNNITLVSRLDTIDDFLDTEVAAIKADTDKIDDATLAVSPVAGSLGRFVASGGTALGTQLPDSKSLYDMVREYGEGYLVSKTYADLTGYDTAAAFTVTGDVKAKVIGVVGITAITSTSGTTVLSLGTTEAPEGIIANTTIDNAQFAATDVWVDATPSVDCEAETATYKIIGGGADIILTRNVDDLTAGTLTLYCFWKPLSAGATVVAA